MEVDRVFTGGRGRGTRTNAAVPPVRVNPTQTDGLASTSSTSSIEGNSSGRHLPFPPQRAFAMRHNFPGRRPPSHNRRQRSVSAIDNKPFLRDLILLGGPQDAVVPRQGARLALMESGHIITGCRFSRGQSEAQVETTIVEAYEGKIPVGVDIELLTSMHMTLVKPSLVPGQNGIDGMILQRSYKNKPVYIRPDRRLIDASATQMGVVHQVTVSSSILSR